MNYKNIFSQNLIRSIDMPIQYTDEAILIISTPSTPNVLPLKITSATCDEEVIGYFRTVKMT